MAEIRTVDLTRRRDDVRLLVSRPQLATLAGVDPRTVERWVERGLPTAAGPSTLDVGACLTWIASNVQGRRFEREEQIRIAELQAEVSDLQAELEDARERGRRITRRLRAARRRINRLQSDLAHLDSNVMFRAGWLVQAISNEIERVSLGHQTAYHPWLTELFSLVWKPVRDFAAGRISGEEFESQDVDSLEVPSHPYRDGCLPALAGIGSHNETPPAGTSPGHNTEAE